MKKLTLKDAIFYICLSTLFVSGPIYILYFGFFLWHDKKIHDPHYNIITIVQSGKRSLDTGYLAEIMALSKDRPTNIYAFDTREAERRLLNSPLIKKAKVTKIKPSAIYVEYKLRKPFLKILDFENMAIDKEGYIFPLDPFFSDDLIGIRLGLNEASWHQKLSSRELILCYKILELLSDPLFTFKLKKIDLSRVYAPSYGKREILLFIEDVIEVNKMTCVFPQTIRLSAKDYVQQMSNFLELEERMRADYIRQIKPNEKSSICNFKPKTIDLRVAKLAFIDE